VVEVVDGMRPPTKRDIPEAYRNTAVPAHRSREEIERLLFRYGATDVAWQSVRSAEQAGMAVRFRRGARVYRLRVDLGAAPQEERQRMRALYWGMKAMLEQAEFGILTFEDVFLAYSELMLPSGQVATVGEVIQGQLERQEMPSLEAPMRALPAPRESHASPDS
jgi:hypothetical protein